MGLASQFAQVGLPNSASVQNSLDRTAGGLGPEHAPGFTGSNWNLDLKSGGAGTVVQDATGVTFTAANNITNCNIATINGPMVDNATYEVTYTITSWSAGSFKVLLDAATVAHGGITTTHSGNGTFTERVVTNQAAANTNRIFFQAVGASGQNTFKLTAISAKRVL